MLDLAGIQLIAQSYSPQELFAALVWQCRFNEFDGEDVQQDRDAEDTFPTSRESKLKVLTQARIAGGERHAPTTE